MLNSIGVKPWSKNNPLIEDMFKFIPKTRNQKVPRSKT